MHPDPRFRPDASLSLADLVAEEPFGQIVAVTPAGLIAAQVPVVLAEDGALHFHLSRANRLAPHLAGADALFTTIAAHGYVSPAWYALPTPQVPTWNYVALEVEGRVELLDEAALMAQLDALSRLGEPDGSGLPQDAEHQAYVTQLLRGISGFRLVVREWRATRKLSQNKPADSRAAVASALDTQGRTELARLMRAVEPQSVAL